MPEEWTGHLIGKMHNHRIKKCDLAAELGVTAAYVTMIFNGTKTPAGARERLEAGVDAIIQRRETAQACPN